jgi:cell division transport system permease protein
MKMKLDTRLATKLATRLAPRLDWRTPELPIAQDDTTRFLPWLMAFMVFLAALSIAGMFVLADAAHTLDRGIEDTITIQVPAGDNQRADEDRIAGAIAMLKQMPGIASAEALPRERVVQLLEPWLGTAARSSEIPLPWVIDVRVDRQNAPKAEMISALLMPYIAGVQVDDHGVWLRSLLRAVHSVEWIAIIVVVLIAVVTAATVVFTTRAGMGLHRDTIEVMHFVGAHDTYIARQFAIRASILGLKGSVIGVALAGPALLILTLLMGNLGFGLLPEIHLSAGVWVTIVALIPIAAAVAMVTARATVMKSLARMV